MISYPQALKSVLQNVISLKSVNIQLKDALHQVVSKDILAPFSSPAFDNSAMDGFAINTFDFKDKTPIKLKCIGESRAGQPYNGSLKRGDCIKCMTGAVIPNGANAVIKVEDSSGFESKIVEFYTIPVENLNIRKKGEEVVKGKVIVKKATKITPEMMGVLTHFGITEFEAYEKINVHLITTGDEVVENKNEINTGSVFNSNAGTLKQLLKMNHCNVIHSHVSDDKQEMVDLLSNFNKDVDLIITTGGISMGEFDFVKEAFAESNIKEVFWKVAQKPGKPLYFGKSGKTVVFGFPGNPVSAIMCFYIYINPFIAKILGLKTQTEFYGKLSEPFNSDKKKYRFLFGEFWIDEVGNVKCKPSKKTGSHMLTSTTNANCILSTPPSNRVLTTDDLINITPL